LTVYTQVIQALADAKSVQANMETFAIQTQDETAKQSYNKAAEQLQGLIDGLEERVLQLEEEEPQNKQT
jgi:hypothetical protein